ncbi:hypothetical protein EIP86_011434 [Pleurotus ostreatoroseus]|nr:hypothetical protein EIP86_011434 [Pleurotus ostreatoroseus]
MSLSSFFSSFLPTVYADAPESKEEEKPEASEEPAEESAEEPAEEEEEEEPEDEECKASKCAAAAKHFAHCEEKVNAGEGYHGETCIEELYVILSLLSDSVSQSITLLAIFFEHKAYFDSGSPLRFVSNRALVRFLMQTLA